MSTSHSAGAGAPATGGSSAAPLPSILSRPLPSGEATISGSTFAFLFSQLVQYCQSRVQAVVDWERKLDDVGYNVGHRFLELVMFRDRPGKREVKLVGMLQFVTGVMWKQLFGKPADALEKSTEHSDVYMIRDNAPLTNKYISVPSDYGQLNCAAFIGGIVHGAMDGAGFDCTVTTHNVDGGGTVFVLKFAPEVMARESM